MGLALAIAHPPAEATAHGSRTLLIEAGAELSNTEGYLGYHFGSTGTDTITGPGSKWLNSGDFYVGLEGKGSLTVENEGQVLVGGKLVVGKRSSVSVAAGSLEIGGANETGEPHSVYVAPEGELVVDGFLQTPSDVFVSGQTALLGTGTVWGNGTIEADLVMILGRLSPGHASVGTGLGGAGVAVPGPTGQLSAVPEASALVLLISAAFAGVFWQWWRGKRV